MGYATLIDVQELNQGRATYTASSKPSATQVADWLDQTAAELDGVLRGRGYALPVATTATSALKLLEGYNAIGAFAYQERAAQNSNRADQAWEMWMHCLTALDSMDLGLAADTDGGSGVTRYGTNATSAFSMVVGLDNGQDA